MTKICKFYFVRIAKIFFLPTLFFISTVLVAAIAVGETHHAIAAGLMTHESVHAELGEIVAGKKAGRERDDEITIFDSTGTAFQDAAMAYEKAVETGRGIIFDLYG